MKPNKEVEAFINRNKLIPQESMLDKIRAYYMDPDAKKLTNKQDEFRVRMEAAWSLLCSYHSPEESCRILMKRYEVSNVTANKYIRESIMLFGDVKKSSKEGMRHILHELAMKTFKISAAKGNEREMNKAIANMIKIQGMDRDDNTGFDPNDIQLPTIIIGNFPEDLNTDLPENWEEEVQEMMKPKRKNDFTDIEDAEVVEDK